ncbi:MAG: hypothetical protein WDN69_28095 [Aliidongia sp.]
MADLGIAVKIVEPGGVTSTDFGKRSGTEAAAAPPPADYAPFFAATLEVFAGCARPRADATSEEVAEVIYTAATDGTDRLRYVATEDIKPLVAARRETSEAEYIAFCAAGSPRSCASSTLCRRHWSRRPIAADLRAVERPEPGEAQGRKCRD